MAGGARFTNYYRRVRSNDLEHVPKQSYGPSDAKKPFVEDSCEIPYYELHDEGIDEKETPQRESSKPLSACVSFDDSTIKTAGSIDDLMFDVEEESGYTLKQSETKKDDIEAYRQTMCDLKACGFFDEVAIKRCSNGIPNLESFLDCFDDVSINDDSFYLSQLDKVPSLLDLAAIVAALSNESPLKRNQNYKSLNKQQWKLLNEDRTRVHPGYHSVNMKSLDDSTEVYINEDFDPLLDFVLWDEWYQFQRFMNAYDNYVYNDVVEIYNGFVKNILKNILKNLPFNLSNILKDNEKTKSVDNFLSFLCTDFKFFDLLQDDEADDMNIEVNLVDDDDLSVAFISSKSLKSIEKTQRIMKWKLANKKIKRPSPQTTTEQAVTVHPDENILKLLENLKKKIFRNVQRKMNYNVDNLKKIGVQLNIIEQDKINAVEAATRLKKEGPPVSLMQRSPLKKKLHKPQKERTSVHKHSLRDSANVVVIKYDVLDHTCDWRHRDVKQGFLHEKSIGFSTNWFGELVQTKEQSPTVPMDPEGKVEDWYKVEGVELR